MVKQGLLNITKVIVGILIFSTIFSGCAAIGTTTIYKTNTLNSYNFKKLGYSQLAREERLNKIRPFTSRIYQVAIEDYCSNQALKIEKHDLPNFEKIENVDTTEIIKICIDNDLDGYICTQIKYKFVDNYYDFIPLGKSEDTFVEMKLYDNHGKLIIYTKHNTSAGNSYMMPPKAEKTVRDGTVGALKQIMKEIKRSKIVV